MKVYGPNGLGGPARSKAAGKTAAGGFKVDTGQAASKSAASQGPSGVSGVDALLALQGADDALTGKKRAIRRADDILDVLEELRIGMLAGTLSKTKLERLLKLVDSRRDSVADPELQDLIEHVDMRARVELAKYEGVLKSSS